MKRYLNIFFENFFESSAKAIGTIFGVAILFVLLISFITWSGLTFGQRCTEMGFESGTSSWTECVHTLANGKAMPRLKEIVPNGRLPAPTE